MSIINHRMICQCGNYIQDEETSTHSPHPGGQRPMDASFVHLSSPPRTFKNDVNLVHVPSSKRKNTNSNGESSSEKNHAMLYDNYYYDSPLFNNGILSTHKYMTSLVQVTEQSLENYSKTGHNRLGEEGNNREEGFGNSDSDNNSNFLCEACIQRIKDSLDENTDQMNMETQAYIRKIEEEKDNQRRMQKALSINRGIQNNDTNHNQHYGEKDDNEHDIIQATIQSLQQEIMNLENVCQDHENEIMNLDQLLLEQAQIFDTLSEQEDELFIEYNTLEKDTKVFEDLHRQLVKQCHSAERERSQLSFVRLNSTLFDIVVDREGGVVRYPLINNLRLSHIPKNNLHWKEINAAWSQAIQLVMFMSSTIKFRSSNLGIVPLTQCAKIIEVDSFGKKVYHHLGVDYESMDRRTHNTDHIVPSIVVFYRLLYQMIIHIRDQPKKRVDLSKIPNEMTRDRIASYEVANKNEYDELLWRGIINCIAQNLKWLSFQL